jgi:hypothetical protein
MKVSLFLRFPLLISGMHRDAAGKQDEMDAKVGERELVFYPVDLSRCDALDRVAPDFERAGGITAQLASKSIHRLRKFVPTEIDCYKADFPYHRPFQSHSSRLDCQRPKLSRVSRARISVELLVLPLSKTPDLSMGLFAEAKSQQDLRASRDHLTTFSGILKIDPLYQYHEYLSSCGLPGIILHPLRS